MKNAYVSFIFLILLFSAPFTSVRAAEYKSSNFIVRDPVLGGIAGYAAAPSFQLFSSGDLVLTGRSDSSSFLGKFGFLHFPFVTEPTLTATPADGQIGLTWTASTAGLGFSVSGYEYGVATNSGGPYTFFNVGNVTSTASTGLTNGTSYYFVVRTLDGTGTPVITSSEVSSTPNGPISPGGGGSSGGGGITHPQFIGVEVNGFAYPGAIVSILKNTVVRATTKADAAGFFATILQEPYDNTILYTLFADDQDGLRSLLLNYPLVINPVSMPKIANVKFAPTIDTDVITIKKGETIVFKGFALPQTDIEFVVNGKTTTVRVLRAESSGRYTFSLPTDTLALGAYEVRAHYPGDTRYSLVIRFTVGPSTVLETTDEIVLPGDCNADRKINLRDFSILAFWYGKPKPPACIDTNHDGIVNLVDFSILAFYWTGS